MANNTNKQKQRLLTAADIYSDDNFPYFKNDMDLVTLIFTAVFFLQ